jgi:hypothetical protein
MLTQIAPDLWHMEAALQTAGIPFTARMTVVRFANGKLWIHSPVRLGPDVRDQIAALGEVAWIVAPNRAHHMFMAKCKQAFPDARLYGAPGLERKRRDIADLHPLGDAIEPDWAGELEQVVVRGMPLINEVVWLHKASSTLIATDLLQCWCGALDWRAAAYARVTGVRSQLDVPRTVRLATRDRAAAAASAQAVLRWPFTRVITAHNAIVDEDAHARVASAFAGAFGQRPG